MQFIPSFMFSFLFMELTVFQGPYSQIIHTNVLSLVLHSFLYLAALKCIRSYVTFKLTKFRRMVGKYGPRGSGSRSKVNLER